MNSSIPIDKLEIKDPAVMPKVDPPAGPPRLPSGGTLGGGPATQRPLMARCQPLRNPGIPAAAGVLQALCGLSAFRPPARLATNSVR